MPEAAALAALLANSQPGSAFPQALAQTQPRHGMRTEVTRG